MTVTDPTKSLKGLRVYFTIILVGITFFIYSQLIGWKWWWATDAKPSEGGQRGFRYFYHK